MTLKTDFPREIERRLGIAGDDTEHVSVWCDQDWLFDCELYVWQLITFAKQRITATFQYRKIVDPTLPKEWSNYVHTKWGRRWERLETRENQTYLYVSGITLVDLRDTMLFDMDPESEFVNQFVGGNNGTL